MIEKPLKATDYIDKFKWVLLLIFVILLLYRLGGYAFWGDEIATIDVASKGFPQLIDQLIKSDRHPPIYFLVIHVWMILAGDSEFAMRLPSVAFSLLTFLLFISYSKKNKLGIIPLLLFMTSPFIVMYARMARYYTLLMFFGVLSIVSLLEFIKKPGRKWMFIYCLSNVLILYTSYPGIILFAVENIYFLIKWKTVERINIYTWLLMQAVVLILYIPWIYVLLFQHIETNFIFRPIDFFLKLGYPLYSYSTGETILPWEFFISVPSLVIFYYLFFRGMRRYNKYVFYLFILPLFIGAAVLSTLFSDVHFPFSSSRVIFLAPVAYTLVAVGVKQIKYGRLLLSLLLCFNIYGLYNYYTARNFHNPAYIVPWKEIVGKIEKDASSNSVVVTPEIPLEHYGRFRLRISSGKNTSSIIDDPFIGEIWLVIRYRGSYNIVVEYEKKLNIILESGFVVDKEYGFLKQDRIGHILKEKFLDVKLPKSYVRVIKLTRAME